MFYSSFKKFIVVAFVVIIAVVLKSNNGKHRNSKTPRHKRAVATAEVKSNCVRTGDVALTFDNGVNADYTPKVLNALNKEGIKGSFHVHTDLLGDSATIEILKRIVTEGHVLGFYASPDPVTKVKILDLSKDELIARMEAQAKALKDVTGCSPVFVRFDYGGSNDTTHLIASGAGFIVTKWSVDSSDYKTCYDSALLKTTIVQTYNDTITGLAKQSLKGSFIGIHNDMCDISLALESLIPMLKANAYRLVSIDDCVGQLSYKCRDGVITAPPPSTSSGSNTVTGPSSGSSTGTSGQSGSSVTNSTSGSNSTSPTNSTATSSTSSSSTPTSSGSTAANSGQKKTAPATGSGNRNSNFNPFVMVSALLIAAFIALSVF